MSSMSLRACCSLVRLLLCVRCQFSHLRSQTHTASGDPDDPPAFYTRTATYSVPISATANSYYAIVVVDVGRVTGDKDYSNNEDGTSQRIDVIESPVPDLHPVRIAMPQDSFSGEVRTFYAPPQPLSNTITRAHPTRTRARTHTLSHSHAHSHSLTQRVWSMALTLVFLPEF